MKYFIFALMILFYGQNVFAQDEALETYEPPPLFAEPKLPPPKIVKPPVDVIAPISREIPESKILPTKNKAVSAPRVIEEVKTLPKPAAPVPTKKPETKIIPVENEQIIMDNKIELINEIDPVAIPAPKLEDEPDEEKKIKLDFKPIKLENLEEHSSEEPIELLKETEPVKNESVVTGPKTMPSNKKEDVTTEEIYINDVQNINILERAQNSEEKTPIAIIPIEEIADFPEDKINVILVYDLAQSNLTDEMIENELLPLAKYLAGNAKSLQIKSYASATANRPNSDRQIALDRGLAIREFLVSQKIEPHRINLKSFGNNTTRQPADFVEINIVE